MIRGMSDERALGVPVIPHVTGRVTITGPGDEPASTMDVIGPVKVVTETICAFAAAAENDQER